MGLLWSLFLFGSLIGYSEIFASEAVVLQMEVSHSRNTDQTSIIFKDKKVELVTNTFTRKDTPRLGRFQVPLSNRLKLLRKQIQLYRKLIDSKKPAIDVSKLYKAIGISQNKKDPTVHHAPVVRLNGKEVLAQHPYFQALKNILRDISQEEKWSCVDCAEYQRKQNNIVRWIRKTGKKPVIRTFSRKHLNCFPLNKNRIECIDPQFGIFEI